MTMFIKLKENRGFVLGAAMVYIAIFHMPLDISHVWLNIFQDLGYVGVDIFLFVSGMGAVHSIGRRGRKDYLRQRALRMLPGLLPVLLVWGLVMLWLGGLSVRQFFGNLTLLGWWMGQGPMLNWYFSAVWGFFLLAVVVYRPVAEGKHPGVMCVAISVVAAILLLITPFHLQHMAYARVPVFLMGMLAGRLEKAGKVPSRGLRALMYGFVPLGLGLEILVFFRFNDYGSTLGLWWYPLILSTPGLVFLLSEVGAFLRRGRLAFLTVPFDALGEGSSEALMIHGGIYKIICECTAIYPIEWVGVMVVSLGLGVAYRRLVVKPFLTFPKNNRSEAL